MSKVKADITIDKDVKKELKEMAKKQGLGSYSAYCNKILKDHIKNNSSTNN